MTYRDAEQIRADYKAQLGEDFGEKLYFIENAFINAIAQWTICKGLFGHSKERVDVMNRVSGTVAFYISKTMYEATLLAFCRLGDPAKTRANKNLTLKSLGQFLEGDTQDEYEHSLIKVDKSLEFARDLRNKMIAHADDAVALGNVELQGATAERFDAVIETISCSLNVINQKLRDTTTLYEEFIGDAKDERVFLRALYLGQKAWEERQATLMGLLEAGHLEEYDNMKKELRLPESLR